MKLFALLLAASVGFGYTSVVKAEGEDYESGDSGYEQSWPSAEGSDDTTYVDESATSGDESYSEDLGAVDSSQSN